jgi:hypothetical protein
MLTTHQAIEQRIREIEDNHEHFVIFLKNYMKNSKTLMRHYRLAKWQEMLKEESKAPNK